MQGPVTKVGRIAVLAAAAALVTGCTSISGFKGYLADEVLMQSVQPGIDNRESVQRVLGQPSFVSFYGEPIWYYVSSTTEQKPFTTPRIVASWAQAAWLPESFSVMLFVAPAANAALNVGTEFELLNIAVMVSAAFASVEVSVNPPPTNEPAPDSVIA